MQYDFNLVEGFHTENSVNLGGVPIAGMFAEVCPVLDSLALDQIKLHESRNFGLSLFVGSSDRSWTHDHQSVHLLFSCISSLQRPADNVNTLSLFTASCRQRQHLTVTVSRVANFTETTTCRFLVLCDVNHVSPSFLDASPTDSAHTLSKVFRNVAPIVGTIGCSTEATARRLAPTIANHGNRTRGRTSTC